MIIVMILVIFAAFFLGWAMGPFVVFLGEKISNSKWAKESEAYDQKRYNTKVAGENYDKGTNNDYFNPEASKERGEIISAIPPIVFLASLGAYFFYPDFLIVKIGVIALLLTIWKPILFFFIHLVFPVKKSSKSLYQL